MKVIDFKENRMIRKMRFCLFLILLAGCSASQQLEKNIKNKETSAVGNPSFTKEQTDYYKELVDKFVVAHMDQILGEAYLNCKEPPLFGFFYHMTNIEGKEYITLFLHEKPVKVSDLKKVFVKGYTNVVFEIDAKRKNLYYPNLIRVYVDYDYLLSLIKEYNLTDEDEFDLRNLMDPESFSGQRIFLESQKKRLLSPKDFIPTMKPSEEFIVVWEEKVTVK